MPNFRSAGAEIFDSEKGIGRKENRAAGAKKTTFYVHIVRSCPVSVDVRLKAEHDKKQSPSSEGLFVYLLSSNGVLSRGLLWVRILMTLTSSFFNSSRVQTMSTIPCSFRYSAR